MKSYKYFLNETDSKTIVFTFGRFQGMSQGHELLIK
jgi:hypothetical protein